MALKKRSVAIRIFVLLLTAISVLSCTKKDEGGQRFLLPWPDESGQEQLKVVTIETLGSPYEVSGPAADIYLQSSFSSSGFMGDPARPHLTLVDGVFVPMDVNSSLGLTLYAHLERIFKLDQELDIAAELSWPRKIGYEVLVQSQESQSLEFNNARYFIDYDVISFLPTSNGKTSLAINPGVIAHEHYHAHFNYRVLQKISQKQQRSEVEVFNDDVILRGWNEGLADYYGFVYSQNPKFLEISLGHDIGEARKMGVEKPHVIRSADFHYDLFVSLRASNYPVAGLGYSVGTDIARVLYWMVQSAEAQAPLSTHKAMLTYITHKLENLPVLYLKLASEKAIQPAQLFEVLFLNENEKVLTTQQCQILMDAVPYVFTAESLENKCL